MKPILGAEGAALIEEIARARSFVALDFDGTLAPIVDDRDAARMSGATRDLLRATALLYPCAVVSGRARADVLARVDGVPLVAVIGNHGAEPGFGPLDRSLAAVARGWLDRLAPLAAAIPGVEIEDKRFSVAIHTRRARDRGEARRRIADAVSALEDAVVCEGNEVVNLVPRGAPTKGDALEALCLRTSTNQIVYVGDDTSDEDAFRCPLVEVAIRVGPSAASSASWYVDGQADVDELLRRLVEARTRSDGLPDAWRNVVRAVSHKPT